MIYWESVVLQALHSRTFSLIIFVSQTYIMGCCVSVSDTVSLWRIDVVPYYRCSKTYMHTFVIYVSTSCPIATQDSVCYCQNDVSNRYKKLCCPLLTHTRTHTQTHTHSHTQTHANARTHTHLDIYTCIGVHRGILLEDRNFRGQHFKCLARWLTILSKTKKKTA